MMKPISGSTTISKIQSSFSTLDAPLCRMFMSAQISRMRTITPPIPHPKSIVAPFWSSRNQISGIDSSARHGRYCCRSVARIIICRFVTPAAAKLDTTIEACPSVRHRCWCGRRRFHGHVGCKSIAARGKCESCPANSGNKPVAHGS